MNKDQGAGIVERMSYGAVVFVIARYGDKLGLTSEDGAWIAGGVVALIGGVWGWWHNRPVSVLNRAADAIPETAKLVITAMPDASIADRNTVGLLADAANNKVAAKSL